VKILRRLRDCGLFQAGDRIAVAVSGGADSVALLRALLELREDLGIVLSVCHLHHGIRGQEADADRDFVADLASGFGLPFHTQRVDVPAFAAASKLSLETAARELRYKFFRELAGDFDKIALGHTRNDQAETILMRLIRGTANTGLAGMPASADLLPGSRRTTMIRPWLQVERSEIEAYLASLGQSWREDSSNAHLHHTRNRIRSELLPLICEHYNPAILEVLAKLAETVRGEESYWEEQVGRLLPGILTPEQPGASFWAIRIETLRGQHPALQRRLLRAAALRHEIMLDAEHTQSLLKLISPASQNGRPGSISLPKDHIATRKAGELRFHARRR
jgi:tRNA(Ile)-lysidine synthase